MSIASRLSVVVLAFGAAAVAGCQSDLTCAPGATLQGNTCVSQVTGCGSGTVLDDTSGVCVPACAAGQYWDGLACHPAPVCSTGTAPGTAGCVPACADGFTWSGGACIADCGAGTKLDPQSGTCVLDPASCADGTHYADGGCVADVVCAPGTHAAGGECVPGLPDPDVTESSDPDVPATFDVPATGGTVILGGTLTTADTARPLPGDRFKVTAPAGTWLRLAARGDDGLRPALRVVSTEPGAGAHPEYERLAYEAGAPAVSREVYLPRTGDYEILVTTQDELLAFVFDGGTFPEGGPDLAYVVEVTNLGTPSPTIVDALPSAPTGDLGGGALSFYRVAAPAADRIVAVSSGAAGLPGTAGDFYPAVLAFDGAGAFVRGSATTDTRYQAELLARQAAGASMLVVQDFFLALGPSRDFRLALTEVTPTLCDAGNCQAPPLPAGGEALLRWSLKAGDLFMVGVYAPTATGLLRLSLHDDGLGATAADQWFDASSVGAAHYYASADTTVSLWLREYVRQATDAMSVVSQVQATHQLDSGQTYTGLGLIDSPPYTYGRFGVDHVVAQAGQLLFFPGFATHAGTAAWVAPQEALTTADFRTVGPILDPSSILFPDYGLTPLIGYARTDAHYLHFVWDAYGDPVGGTYDVGLSVVGTADLGAPTAGHPVGVATQVLNGLKAYRFTGAANQSLTITVTPSFVSTQFQPELWVMTFGAPEFYWTSYRWAPDPDALQLGVAAHETGATPGQPLAVDYTSPYDGETVLMVEDAGTGTMNVFQILVTAN